MPSDQEQILAEDELENLAAILHDIEAELFVMMQKMGETLSLLPENVAFLSKAMDLKAGGELDCTSYELTDRAVRVNSRLLLMQVLALQTVQLTGWQGLKDWADRVNDHRVSHLFGLDSSEGCAAYHEQSDNFAQSLGFGGTKNLKMALLISNMIDDDVIVAIINSAVEIAEEGGL